MVRVILIATFTVVAVSALLGATVASLNTHPFWYVSRASAFMVGLALGAFSSTRLQKVSRLSERGLWASLLGVIVAFLSLPILDAMEPSLVSSRSYGHVIGSIIFVLLGLLVTKFISKIIHLTNAGKGRS